jgi:hypothetical protein
MMSIPFFMFAGGMAVAYYGRRDAAMGLWAVGLVVLLFLFKLHATEALDIGL